MIGGTVCNFATQLKFYLDYDDALDIFAVHAIGGMVGNVCPIAHRNACLLRYIPYRFSRASSLRPLLLALMA